MISTRITQTQGEYQGETIDFGIGVPQGAVLSPVLFNLFINELVQLLNEKGFALAFADDLVAVAKGLDELDLAIQITENWCKVNQLEINKTKSAIMGLRKDRRTPLPIEDEYLDYPVVNEYNYLGVILDDRLFLDIETKKKQKQETKLKKVQLLIQNNKMPAQVKYTLVHSLYKSKVWYQMPFLTEVSETVREWANKFLYRSIKILFNIKANPDRGSVF